MDIKGKNVLITGATGGMAYEIAKLLFKEDCRLALFARREEKLKKIAAEFTENTTKVIFQVCDVTKRNDVISMVDYSKNSFGRIDIAILSAGILTPNPIQTFNSSIIRNSMDINFMGIVYAIEQLLPVMKKQKSGTIVALSTLPDRRGVPGWGAYGASKAAVSWLLESLRAEAKQRYNIDIITVKPGSVNTPMIAEYHRQGAVTPERAAHHIIEGIKKSKKIIQFPLNQVLMIRIQDLFPVFAYDMMPVELAKGEGYPKVEEE
jgi:short-subunit dehydrogenase